MADTALIVVYAVLAWWSSTGVVLYFANQPPSTFRWTMMASTALSAVALLVLWWVRADTTVAGAYVSFTAGLVAWSWLEVSFYTDTVTGPRKAVCAPDCGGLAHFGHALQASLYHEIAAAIGLAAVAWLTWDQPNRVGLWTFLVLLVMHESARLNVLLGVANLSEEFVPDHLAFLRGFLTRKSMNLLFPVSVTLSTVATVLIVQKAIAAADGFEAAAWVFTATVLVLAILEHWFLVVPLPSGRLWSWSIAHRKSQPVSAARATECGPGCACERPVGEGSPFPVCRSLEAA